VSTRIIALSCGIAAIAFAVGCTGEPVARPVEEKAPGNLAGLVAARGVSLSIPNGNGEVAVRAGELLLDGDGKAMLEGDVRVTIDGTRFEARGERLEIEGGWRRIALEGGVRAAFEVSAEGGDAL